MDKKKIARIISIICMIVIICMQVISIIKGFSSINKFVAKNEIGAIYWLIPLLVVTAINIGLLIATYIGYKKNRKYGAICGIIEGVLLIIQSGIIFKVCGAILLIISVTSINELDKESNADNNKKEKINNEINEGNKTQNKNSGGKVFVIILVAIIIVLAIIMWYKIGHPKTYEDINNINKSSDILDNQKKALENYYDQNKMDREILDKVNEFLKNYND